MKQIRYYLVLITLLSAFMAKAQTITLTTTTLAAQCKGATVDITFTATGTFRGGNIFTAQLSSATGSFTAPTSIGTLKATTGGTISATIPATAISGTGYLIRVISSNPAATSGNTTSAFEIKDCPMGGGVTSVSVVSANGFAGSVATATTTPAITLSTSVTGLLKGNGTGMSAAVAGTDFLAPNASITGASKTKITYDANGLVTAGADAGIADITGLQTALDGKLAGNTAITGASKTKITYDANGLVTAGADAGIADITGLQTALDGKLAGNTAITGATKTKITYDAKGLVTAGADASLSDLSGVLISSPSNNQVLTYNGTNWVNANASGGGGSGWSLTGNSGLSSSTNFIGTTDNVDLVFKVNGQRSGIISGSGTNYFSTSMGYQALKSNTTGNNNNAFGYKSLYSNTSGNYNLASGYEALYSNTYGGQNTATGTEALYTNTIGSNNTATGYRALYNNTTSSDNTATGNRALYNNTTGSKNIATGSDALFRNTTGSDNIATGYSALYYNTTGYGNIAIGNYALEENTENENMAIGNLSLQKNTTGNSNTAIGKGALQYNISGSYNNATGYGALSSNQSGYDNTATGYTALFKNTTGYYNTAIGNSALYENITGNRNTAIGFSADVSSSALTNATAIGNSAIVDASNKVRIGNSSITVIEGPVALTTPSDGRFKKNVKEDAPGLNLIMKLRPVTYNFEYTKFSDHLKEKNADKAHLQQRESQKEMGFVAQEVEKALKDIGTDVSNLVNIPQSSDGHYSLAYSELVVPLVRAVQEQQKIIEELKKVVDALQKQSAPNTSNDTQTTGSAADMEMQTSGVLLGQNIPNPFNNKTIIPFQIPAGFGEGTIVISNLNTGQVLKTYMVTNRDTQLSVDMSYAASGIYAYTLYVNGKAAATKKLVVSR